MLAACGRGERPPTIDPPAPRPVVATAPATTSAVLPPATRQLVTAIVPAWDATTAELRLWTRHGVTWKPAGPSWRGVVGKTGTAWGVGLHGRGVPAGRTGPLKREGDGKSPAGVFALAGTYGYAATPPTGALMSYTQVDPSWKCVDDPASAFYNQIVDQRNAKPDWTSAEEMKRTDELYTWVIHVAHNAPRTPGEGSCIFLHVWSGPESSTVGCTAMEEPRLAALIADLDPAALPAFVLLPRAEYAALATAWSLPPP